MEIRMTAEGNFNILKHIQKIEDPTFWKFGANEWWKLITPYTPMETGTLFEAVKVKSERGSGEIEYTQPQAHYLYEGELMVDAETGSSYAREGSKKVYAGRELNIKTARHPLASKEWDKAAEPTQKPELIRSMQKYIDSGRLKLNE